MTCGIYKITNLVNGKVYVGLSKNIEERWQYHLFPSVQKIESNKLLYKAIKKYGEGSFEFSVLEECAEDYDVLTKREIYWIEKINCVVPNGYNFTAGGHGYSAKTWARLKSETDMESRRAKSIKKSRSTSESRELTRSQALSQWANPAARAIIVSGLRKAQTTDVKLKRANSVKKYWDNNPDRKVLHAVRSSGENSSVAKSVVCVETGQIFVTVRQAANSVGVTESKVSLVCNGRRKSAGGFRWMLKSDWDNPTRRKDKLEQFAKKTTHKRARKILCVETGEVFDSETSASKAKSANHIVAVCKGNRKTSGGYRWMYYDDWVKTQEQAAAA